MILLSIGLLLVMIGLGAPALQYCDDDGACRSFWATVVTLPPNAIGDTLAGVFGSLAFVAAAIALVMQSSELSAQRKELQLTREEFAKMSEAQAQQVEIMEQQTRLLSMQNKGAEASQWGRVFIAQLERLEVAIVKLFETNVSVVIPNGSVRTINVMECGPRHVSKTSEVADFSIDELLSTVCKISDWLDTLQSEHPDASISPELVRISQLAFECASSLEKNDDVNRARFGRLNLRSFSEKVMPFSKPRAGEE
ncbi:MAG: hypothetical protein AAF227_00210 [Pseudomonadota bacterium]